MCTFDINLGSRVEDGGERDGGRTRHALCPLPTVTNTHTHSTPLGHSADSTEHAQNAGVGGGEQKPTEYPLPSTHGCSSCHLPGVAGPRGTGSGKKGPRSHTGTHIHGRHHCKGPGLKGETSQDESGWTPPAKPLALRHKYKRALLTLTAPPIGQQVVTLSAAALGPPKGANTFVLAAVVPKAAVVNGWWEERDGKVSPLIGAIRELSPGR